MSTGFPESLILSNISLFPLLTFKMLSVFTNHEHDRGTNGNLSATVSHAASPFLSLSLTLSFSGCKHVNFQQFEWLCLYQPVIKGACVIIDNYEHRNTEFIIYFKLSLLQHVKTQLNLILLIWNKSDFISVLPVQVYFIKETSVYSMSFLGVFGVSVFRQCP